LSVHNGCRIPCCCRLVTRPFTTCFQFNCPYNMWHLGPCSPLATIDMGQKLGAVPLFWVGGSPSNTKSPGPRPPSIPSGILVHPAVWPQQTWVENWGGLYPLGEVAFYVRSGLICGVYTDLRSVAALWQTGSSVNLICGELR